MRGGFGSDQSSMDRDSFEEFSAEEMIVMSDNIDNLNIEEEREDEEPCKSLIVTNVDSSVFVDEMAKADFESLFLAFDKTAAFYYIRTFRRVRIDFEGPDTAASAKTHLDMKVIGSSPNPIHCYFFKVYGPSDPEAAYLQPPPLEKQFLISPPCSPPVGWEQPREDHPVVDYDLLAAISQLAPGENHELQPSTSVTIRGASIHTPSIVVQVCGNQEEFASFAAGQPRNVGKIIQTRCPERQHSLED